MLDTGGARKNTPPEVNELFRVTVGKNSFTVISPGMFASERFARTAAGSILRINSQKKNRPPLKG
jgi:hypothetical protein